MNFQRTIQAFLFLATATMANAEVTNNDVTPARGMLRGLTSMTPPPTMAPRPREKITECPDESKWGQLAGNPCQYYDLQDACTRYHVTVNNEYPTYRDTQCSIAQELKCDSGVWRLSLASILAQSPGDSCTPETFDQEEYKDYDFPNVPAITTCPDESEWSGLPGSSCRYYDLRDACSSGFIVTVDNPNPTWRDVKCTPTNLLSCDKGQWNLMVNSILPQSPETPCDPENFDPEEFKDYNFPNVEKISTCPNELDWDGLNGSSCQNYDVRDCSSGYLVTVDKEDGTWEDLQCTPTRVLECEGGQWNLRVHTILKESPGKSCHQASFDPKEYKHHFNRCARKQKNCSTKPSPTKTITMCQNYGKTFYVSTSGTGVKCQDVSTRDQCEESVIALSDGSEWKDQHIKVSMLCPRACGLCAE